MSHPGAVSPSQKNFVARSGILIRKKLRLRDVVFEKRFARNGAECGPGLGFQGHIPLPLPGALQCATSSSRSGRRSPSERRSECWRPGRHLSGRDPVFHQREVGSRKARAGPAEGQVNLQRPKRPKRPTASKASVQYNSTSPHPSKPKEASSATQQSYANDECNLPPRKSFF